MAQLCGVSNSQPCYEPVSVYGAGKDHLSGQEPMRQQNYGVYGSLYFSVSVFFKTLLYYPNCTMWHLENKNIIHASAKHYSSFPKFTHANIPNHILKSGHHMDCSCSVLLSWYAHCVGSWLCISDRAALCIILLFSLRSCVQWEDEVGMGQVRNTNRQCRKVNENLQWACREAGSAV